MANAEGLDVTVKLSKLGRMFFARPCDDGRKPEWAWCVEEVQVLPSLHCQWRSTLYEPVLSVHMKGIDKKKRMKFVHMTKAQAKREAKLWQRDYDIGKIRK